MIQLAFELPGLGCRNGQRARPERVVFCELSQAFGDAEASEAIALEQVVACVSNDMTASGAMHTAFEAGLKVPEDLSVIGFDDITLHNLIEGKSSRRSVQPAVATRRAAVHVHTSGELVRIEGTIFRYGKQKSKMS